MTTAGFATWSGASGSATTVFKYDLVPNLSSLTVTINSDNANGTTFFTQALSVTLQKIDHDMTNELRLMAMYFYWGLLMAATFQVVLLLQELLKVI